MNQVLLGDMLNALPLVGSVFLCAVVVLTEAVFRRVAVTRYVSLFGVIALIGSVVGLPDGVFAFDYMVKVDIFAKLSFLVILCSVAIFMLYPTKAYLDKKGSFLGEFYAISFMAMTGMLFMVSASHFIMLFLGIEITSISFYLLSGLLSRDKRSNEAAIKYFLLGAFSSGFLLYGVAFIYGATGFLSFPHVLSVVGNYGGSPLFYVGIILVFVGMLFKISAVPFHQWVVDVYEGAPIASTTFMASVGKGALFLAFGSVSLNFAFIINQNAKLQLALKVIAVASMLIGNIAALSQTNLLRMLAYSSIGHAGFVLAGVAANSMLGYISVITYALIYTVVSLGTFGVLQFLAQKHDITEVKDLAGLYKERLGLALVFSVLILCLAGMPPTAGFVAKYTVFMASLQKGDIVLAGFAALASAIGLTYYLKIVYTAFSNVLHETLSFGSNKPKQILLIGLALLVLLMGLSPARITDAAESAVKAFFVRE